MTMFWDEGLQTSIYRLQTIAAATGNMEFQLRATELENRLKTQWIPMFSSLFIKGDALKLGQELAAATGIGRIDPTSSNPDPRPNVLYEEDTTLGGRVGTVKQEDFVSGDVGAGISAALSDVGTTVQEEATAIGVPVVAHQLAIYARYLAVALVVLLVFYVYLRATR